MRKIDITEFCNRCNKIHNNKYDYSNVEYKDNRTKVRIICPIHGEFSQRPETHMNGFGCSKCSNNYNYTTGEFIDKLKSIFNDKISYDNIEYINQKTKVEIICKIHGSMKKYPISLLRGSGCSKCESKNYKIDTTEFIRRSKNIHGDRYIYDKVVYKNDNTHVNIICKEHGIFKQIPNIHLSGSGCITCSGRYRSNNEEFIEKSNLIHNNVYNYDLVNYKNAHTKVEIICKKHGIFNQKPNSHLSGQGCPSCKESKGELSILNFLIENNITHERQKTFKGCEYKSLLFFDFFISNKNLCIEYDGEFHFLPVFSQKDLNKTKIRDNIKNEYCENNNIKLLRIKYTDFENIENILSENLTK